MTSFGNKIYFKIFLILISTFFFINSSKGVENKIIVKINNEIVTALDIENEIQYLRALNKNIDELEYKKIYSIAKQSLIREKVKKTELFNYVENISINEKLLQNVIKSTYTRIGIKSKIQFEEYIKNFNLTLDMIEKKISTEVLWNELIVSKFSKKIKIDKENIKNNILLKKDFKIKEYLLSEILFEINETEKIDLKSKKISESIKKNGFENTASIFSISDSSKLGGKIGWINENSLNKKLKKDLDKLKIGEITNPIVSPGGFLILKINDIKLLDQKINLEEEIKKIINIERNKQLTQYSNIYYKKIKKDVLINEL